MIGSYIEFGTCGEINTSNYLTATLVNNEKCRGNNCFPSINSCWCPADEFEHKDAILGDPSFRPWYDPYDPASSEYLGKIVLKYDGLQTSSYDRSIDSTINGPVASRCNVREREVLVDGLMFAISRRGMEYGKRWEREQLWRSFCGCESSYNVVKLRLDCDDELHEVRNFVVKSGPVFEPWKPNDPCCDYVSRFSYTAAVLDPYLYKSSVDLGYERFDECTALCESWECETVQHVCGPECCTSCTRPVRISGLYDFGSNDSCYSRPIAKVMKSFPVSVPTTGYVGFDFRVFSGDEPLHNTRILLVDSQNDPVEYDGDNYYDFHRIVAAAEVTSLPAETLVTVDGKSNCVSASCDADDVIWVFDAGGLPFSGFRVQCSDVMNKLWVLFETDYFTYSDTAQVGVSVYRMV